MNLELTPKLLNFLKAQGFRYCLSKTTFSGSDEEQVKIELKPTKYKPNTRCLPGNFDTHFAIGREPTQMAKGVNDLLIMVGLDIETSALYILSVLHELKKSKKPNAEEVKNLLKII
ncbi:hypothetical protein FPZ43_16725 [Mucilaginibacter pallidiroseus]|uniref:Uncharacterized protein n=1 Tax=Mucilaginibacter pallidiroseus TaxID=2599295 RepID=A0A563U2D8_9SPHI|nr:hypothetical protein [Mucilaginibacter pallidiroseus]TWR25119.1 hypothetical protein FPZ43_16725 [Mucilaginibacter pallidiroseus]